jgi:transposase-like protein
MTSTSSSDSSAVDPSPLIQTVPVTVDTKGRVRASKEQRRVILAEFERSGVSAAQFAKLTGLKYSTLAGWLQRYRRTKPPGRARQVRLLEAVVEQSPGAGGQNPTVMVLQLPGGVRLEVADERQAALAAVLVRALAGSC